MALYAEMIEAIVDLGRDQFEVKDAAAEKERPQQREIFADWGERPERFAVTNRPILGRDCDEGDGTAEVEATRHAVGFLRRQHIFERREIEADNFRCSEPGSLVHQVGRFRM